LFSLAVSMVYSLRCFAFLSYVTPISISSCLGWLDLS
jgi:hypothetical protein